MRSGLRVTFVGHDASRTGAPIVLRSLLRWAQRNTDDRVALVLQRGGPLTAEYHEVANVVALESRVLDLVGGARRGSASVGLPLGAVSAAEGRLLRRVARRLGPSDVVVANTLASLATALTLAGDLPVVCHVHELDHVAARILGPRTASLVDRVAHFVATGAAVERMLCDRWGVDVGRVTTVDAFIDTPRPLEADVDAAARSMGDPGRPVVLSVGALSHRKGPERFVDLVRALADHPSRPVGVWLGGDLRSTEAAELHSDVERAGLGASFRALGEVEDPLPYLAAADVVVSTAREDPFPLSLLEAVALGRPVVAARSGGLAEVLSGWQGPSHVVPAGDVLGVVAAVERVLEDPMAARARAAEAAAKISGTHLTDVLAPAVWSAIERVGRSRVTAAP